MEEGFIDWKHALEGWKQLGDEKVDPKKLKGFAQHVMSSSHISSMSAWRDKENREKLGKTFENVVLKLENDNKKWLEVIFTVVRYLAAEGLPFRDPTDLTVSHTTLLNI